MDARLVDDLGGEQLPVLHEAPVGVFLLEYEAQRGAGLQSRHRVVRAVPDGEELVGDALRNVEGLRRGVEPVLRLSGHECVHGGEGEGKNVRNQFAADARDFNRARVGLARPVEIKPQEFKFARIRNARRDVLTGLECEKGLEVRRRIKEGKRLRILNAEVREKRNQRVPRPHVVMAGRIGAQTGKFSNLGRQVRSLHVDRDRFSSHGRRRKRRAERGKQSRGEAGADNEKTERKRTGFVFIRAQAKADEPRARGEECGTAERAEHVGNERRSRHQKVLKRNRMINSGESWILDALRRNLLKFSDY